MAGTAQNGVTRQIKGDIYNANVKKGTEYGKRKYQKYSNYCSR